MFITIFKDKNFITFLEDKDSKFNLHSTMARNMHVHRIVRNYWEVSYSQWSIGANKPLKSISIFLQLGWTLGYVHSDENQHHFYSYQTKRLKIFDMKKQRTHQEKRHERQTVLRIMTFALKKQWHRSHTPFLLKLQSHNNKTNKALLSVQSEFSTTQTDGINWVLFQLSETVFYHQFYSKLKKTETQFKNQSKNGSGHPNSHIWVQ